MNHHVMPDFYKLGKRLLFYRLRTSTFYGTDFASAVIDKRAIALDVIYYRIFTKFNCFCTNRFTVERSCFQLCTFNIFDVMNRVAFQKKRDGRERTWQFFGTMPMRTCSPNTSFSVEDPYNSISSALISSSFTKEPEMRIESA